MKRPKSVIIQGHTYKIIADNSFESLEKLEKGNLRGCIEYPSQSIFIEPNQHDEAWFLTLIHECVHGFYNHMGLPENEKHVDNLATAIFTFLSENKLWSVKKK